MKELINKEIFGIIGKLGDQRDTDVYVVGGYVRDQLLKRKDSKDIDFVAVGSGIELATALNKSLKGSRLSVFKNFGTAQVRYKDLDLEFVGARKESYRRESRKPIVEDGTLDDDQKRRDFTINTMAIGLNQHNHGQLIDPFEGVKDLDAAIIRTPLDPHITYSDDPLRMLRAIRFAGQLNFKIEESSLAAIKETRDRIKIISIERVTDELNKIMLSPKPSVGLQLFYDTGLMEFFLPEICALKGVEEIDGQLHKDNFYHTLQVVDNLAERSDNLWLRYAALFHDIGKAVTKKFIAGTGWTFHNHEYVGSRMVFKIFKRMKLNLGPELKYVQKIINLSSRPIAVADEQATDSAARRLLFDAGVDIEELMLLCESDITTRNERKKKKFLSNFQSVRTRLKEVEESDRVRVFQPPVDGQEIMATFDLKPGPEIGRIKEAIKEAILEGDIKNNEHEAREFMLRKGEEMGLKIRS